MVFIEETYLRVKIVAGRHISSGIFRSARYSINFLSCMALMP
jgi:hypothetical protein